MNSTFLSNSPLKLDSLSISSVISLSCCFLKNLSCLVSLSKLMVASSRACCLFSRAAFKLSYLSLRAVTWFYSFKDFSLHSRIFSLVNSFSSFASFWKCLRSPELPMIESSRSVRAVTFSVTYWSLIESFSCFITTLPSTAFTDPPSDNARFM